MFLRSRMAFSFVSLLLGAVLAMTLVTFASGVPTSSNAVGRKQEDGPRSLLRDDNDDDHRRARHDDDKRERFDNDDDDFDDDDRRTGGGRRSSETISNPATAGSDDSCFPGTATVLLRDGQRKTMFELTVGDHVQVGPAQFSEVFMFTHKMEHVQHDFVTLRTAAGPVLSLTSAHYIYSNGALVAAGSVKVGDTLTLADGSLSPVIDVTVAHMTGLYNPQTVHGSIMVDGILASTYTAAIHPKIAHAMLAPLRGLFRRFAFASSAGEQGAGSFSQYFPKGAVLHGF